MPGMSGMASRAFEKLEALEKSLDDLGEAVQRQQPIQELQSKASGSYRGAKAQAAVPVELPMEEGASAYGSVSEASVQGQSHTDGEGCVGGSLPHVHTEGESHEEHRRHELERELREAEESIAAQTARDMAAMNVHRLRQAVIMSEILDRPVALTRRGSRGREAL